MKRRLLSIIAAIVLVPVLVIGGVAFGLLAIIGGQAASANAGTGACTVGDAGTALTVTTTGGDSLTLDEKQLANAAKIITVGTQGGVSAAGIKVALMTALQESKLRMLANSTVPASLDYPHEGVGSDHDSVNMFQQRPHWGKLADLMDANYSIRAFFGGPNGPNAGSPRGLLDINGWDTMPPGQAAQKVQVSAFPDAYDQWEGAAETIVNSMSGSISCDGGQVIGQAAYPLSPGYNMTSGYGPRDIDVPGAPTWHAAIDLQHWPNNCNDPVYAILPGTVTLSSELFLSVRHPDGFIVSYLHMYKSERLVDVGDEVKAGQQIGVTGNVPPSGGCHLDLRINKNGTTNSAVAALQEAPDVGAPAMYAGYVNPEEFLRLYGIEVCPSDSCRRP